MVVSIHNIISDELSITTTFVGDTKEELIEEQEKYMSDYHPCGYSTRITKEIEKNDNNKWNMTIFRMKSCD